MKTTNSFIEGVYNADVFKVLVDYEIARSRRYPSPLALIEIEARPVSSQESVLKAAPDIFLSALIEHLRSVDIPSQNEDSFIVMLPTTDENGARAVCERLLSVFKNRFEISDGASVVFTLQIGATAHGGGVTLSSEEMFSKARSALKQSKSKGSHTYVMSV